MLPKNRYFFLSAPFLYLVAITLGIITGYSSIEALFDAASYVSEAFMNLLKLVSLPIMFLSIVTVSSGMENINVMATMGKKVIKYTLFTTVIAAAVALLLFILIDPAQGSQAIAQTVTDVPNYEGVMSEEVTSPFNERGVDNVAKSAIWSANEP